MRNPKYKRLVKQVIPFALLWCFFALIYSLVEGGIMGDLSVYPATGNLYDFKTNLTFTTVSSLLIGTLQGWIEVSWLRRSFKRRPLWVKLVVKTLFYTGFIFLFLISLGALNSFLNYSAGNLGVALIEASRFLDSFAFWSIMIYIGAMVTMVLFFSEIGQYLGEDVLYNFIFGKYHRPKKETRIFMFLDMKSSTKVAEELGHERYFDLLKRYYDDISDAILRSSGSIYQYVGDEIVVSWNEKDGLYRNNCTECFRKILMAFQQKEDAYKKDFGLVPGFKAGFHLGEVTTGEIGIIKKEIIYTGDVLNTAARIQAECNTYEARLLLSADLMERLSPDPSYRFDQIGALHLRGKKEPVVIYSLNFDP